MKAIEVKLGAKVTNRHFRKGVIVSNSVAGSDDETVIVEWLLNHLEKCNVNELTFTPDILERDWKAVQAKLDEASKAIAAANQLISKSGGDSDLYTWNKEGVIDTSELFDQIDCGGWQTSTMTSDC